MTPAQKLEMELMEKTAALAALRRAEADAPVANHRFATLDGETDLLGLFGDRETLLLIHNMGAGCRYCAVWADGINGILHHLEDAMAVVLVSKDAPAAQRRMALERGWRFRTASHGGGDYMAERCSFGEHRNMPGAAVYARAGDAVVARGQTFFGPGDIYSPLWSFLSLAGLAAEDWTPQFSYWSRPAELEDGGENVAE